MNPTVLSPASPAELLHYIVTFQPYPTTLLICYQRQDFISALVSDSRKNISQQNHEQPEDLPPLPLLSATLLQTAIARHIRILFIPSVTHLRAFLSAFDTSDSLTPPPPNIPSSDSKSRPPLLLVYGFLDLHRDSSEWSAQGLSSSAAVLIEAARRAETKFKPVIVEPRGAGGHEDFTSLLRDDAPVLSGSSRRSEGVWMGRTVENLDRGNDMGRKRSKASLYRYVGHDHVTPKSLPPSNIYRIQPCLERQTHGILITHFIVAK